MLDYVEVLKEKYQQAVEQQAGLRREHARAFLENQYTLLGEMADLMTDDEVEKLNRLVEAWEEPNDEFGRIFHEQYNAANYSKDKAVKEAAQKLIDDAREKANKAFEPVEAYIDELYDKYESQLDLPELVDKPKGEPTPTEPTAEQRAVDELAAQLDDYNSPKNDELIQQIADLNTEASERWLDENVRGQKGDRKTAAPTKGQITLVKKEVDVLNEAGIPTHLVTKAGQRMLDKYRELVRLMNGGKRKTTSETVKLNSPEGEKAYVTVVSDAESGAKVRKNLDTLAKKYEEKSESPRTLLKDIAEAIEANQRGSGSKYVTIEAQNGNIVTIRLSNHNSSVRNFDNNGESEGVSIVVAGTPNNGIENNGDAHVMEFFYRAQDLRSAEGKPLVNIIRSVEQMRCRESNQKVTPLELRKLIREEWEKMKADRQA